MSILSGSLDLGKDSSWREQQVLSDLYLYTQESNEESPIYEVNFNLKAIVNYTAVKIVLFKRNRWQLSVEEDNDNLSSYLNQVFNQETNVSGTTKKALLVELNLKIDTKLPLNYPLSPKSNMLIYGEKKNSTINMYAHPLYDDSDFLPVYDSSTIHLPCNNSSHDQLVLDELFESANENLPSPLTAITNQLTEMEIVNRIEIERKDKVVSRDLISEARNAMAEKQQLLRQRQSNHLAKSKISLFKSKSTLTPTLTNLSTTSYKLSTNEKKDMIRELVKNMLPPELKEDVIMNQLIYTSIRNLYRTTNISSKPSDVTKMRQIIKMHVEFYSHMEDVVKLVYSNNEEM